MLRVEIKTDKNGAVVAPSILYTVAGNRVSEQLIEKIRVRNAGCPDSYKFLVVKEEEISLLPPDAVAIFDGVPRKRGGSRRFIPLYGNESTPSWFSGTWSVIVSKNLLPMQMESSAHQISAYFFKLGIGGEKKFTLNLKKGWWPWGNPKSDVSISCEKKITDENQKYVDQVWTSGSNKLLPDVATLHFVLNDSLNIWAKGSDSIPLHQLKTITEKGMTVRALTHMGNMSPRVSVYPHLGVQVCDYLGNQSVRDTNNQPEKVIQAGVVKTSAVQTQATLVPYLANSFNKSFAAVHFESKKNFPGYCLEDELFNFPFVKQMLTVLLENQDYILQGYANGIFNRQVSCQGIVTDCEAKTHSSVVDEYIALKLHHSEAVKAGIPASMSGPLAIKEIFPILDIVTNYYNQYSGSRKMLGDVFTISGSQMINYLKKRNTQEVIGRMYEVLYKAFDWLPTNMRYIVLPGTSLGFIPSSAEVELEKIVWDTLNVFFAKKQVEEKLVAAISADNAEEKDVLLSQKRELSLQLQQYRKEYLRLSSERRGFTQHDIAGGEKVNEHIFHKIMPLSFKELATLF